MSLDLFVDLPTALMLACAGEPWRVALFNRQSHEVILASGTGLDDDVECVFATKESQQTIWVSWTMFEQQTYRRLEGRGYAYHPRTRFAPEA